MAQITNIRRSRIRNNFASIALAWDRRGYVVFHKALISQVNMYLRYAKKVGFLDTSGLDGLPFEKIINDAINKFYFDIAQVELNNVEYQNAQKKISLNIFQAIANYINRFLGGRIGNISQTTRKYIIRQIALSGATDIESLTKELEKQSILKNRALMIARTETITGLNLTRLIKADASRYMKVKHWIDSHDARVRPAGRNTRFNHHANTIPPVPYNEPFTVSGEKLMFPGDVSQGASGGNTIRCRCSVYMENMKDKNGRLIIKDREADNLNSLFGFYEIKTLENAY